LFLYCYLTVNAGARMRVLDKSGTAIGKRCLLICGCSSSISFCHYSDWTWQLPAAWFAGASEADGVE
jgi:hypothetical protein